MLMALSIAMIVVGLAILVWSADIFVEGAASVARSLGMSSLLVGMIVIGFGTSAPELSVSALSAFQGNPGIALGNAYGSNITNIALVLGITALISPVIIQSQILKKELPILLFITVIAYIHIYDGDITRLEAVFELVVLTIAFVWMTIQSQKKVAKVDALVEEVETELPQMSSVKAWAYLLVGLLLLVVSSRMLVWGAVNIAQTLGVSDLVIGLTVVAIGTSLPELASSIIAARKGEHDLVVGNVIGSNMFNTLAVVGLAGVIYPMQVPSDVISRDWIVMMLLTVMLFVLGYTQRSGDESRINRFSGGIFLAIYIAYTIYLIASVVH
jgi:cation:H+ antiporter